MAIAPTSWIGTFAPALSETIIMVFAANGIAPIESALIFTWIDEAALSAALTAAPAFALTIIADAP